MRDCERSVRVLLNILRCRSIAELHVISIREAHVEIASMLMLDDPPPVFIGNRPTIDFCAFSLVKLVAKDELGASLIGLHM